MLKFKQFLIENSNPTPPRELVDVPKRNFSPSEFMNPVYDGTQLKGWEIRGTGGFDEARRSILKTVHGPSKDFIYWKPNEGYQNFEMSPYLEKVEKYFGRNITGQSIVEKIAKEGKYFIEAPAGYAEKLNAAKQAKTQNMSSGLALDPNAPAVSGKPTVGSVARSVGSAVKGPGGAAIIGGIAGETIKPALEKSGATDWLADKLTPFIPDWALGSSQAEKVRQRAEQLQQETNLTGGKPLSTSLTGMPNPITGTKLGDEEEDEQAMKIVRAKQQAKK